jgi:hypothetical protein
MRPVRIIAAVVFAILTLLTAPAWAAPAAPTALRVSPNSVAAGDSVTVSGSVGPESAGSECASGVRLLSRAFVHTQDFAGVPAVDAAVRRNGTFTATTTIPRSRAAGSYTITGRCGGANFGGATLVVRAPASPTTTPAPTPPPATGPTVTPPAGPAPAVTGLPTQPATPAAAHLASRWIIPGLVALGSGTLAALGVWALYRRRHPAGPSQQGRSRMAH